MKNPTLEELAAYFEATKIDHECLCRLDAECAPLLSRAVCAAGVGDQIMPAFQAIAVQFGLAMAVQSIWANGAVMGLDFAERRQSGDELEKMFASKESA